MPRVMITGAGGQVGTALQRADWPVGVDVVPADRRTVDICDPGAVQRFADDVGPRVIINAAALTAVDRAEAEPDDAFAVNDRAVDHLVAAADRHGAVLIQLSTDYVFDGAKRGWYFEDDPALPCSVYGASKLAGERRALTARRAIVVRTSWVYGTSGHNFVLAIRHRAKQGQPLGVVADQWGCPTAADDVAEALVAMVKADCAALGVFHVAAPDDASRWELADQVVQRMELEHRPPIHPLTTSDFGALARRPANSRLDSSRVADVYRIVLPSWRVSLDRVSAELNGGLG